VTVGRVDLRHARPHDACEVERRSRSATEPCKHHIPPRTPRSPLRPVRTSAHRESGGLACVTAGEPGRHVGRAPSGALGGGRGLSAARVKLADAFPREAGGPCDRREGDPLVAGDPDLGAEPRRCHRDRPRQGRACGKPAYRLQTPPGALELHLVERGIQTHELRYTAAQELHDLTENIVLSQQLLRHEDIRTTRGYVRDSQERLRAAQAALEASWK
jgi:hypothetical protein